MSSTAASPLWHPFTQHGLEPVMTPIARGEGAWLETTDGKRIFDAISSWWVVTHGHCHPKIVAAIRDQAGKLDQVIFAGFTHEPAESVARELLKIVPRGLAHVFLSDSGSTAVEVALKMALGYWRNRGQTKRTRILALEHAYHGDTIGTMSAGARGIFNAAYGPLLFDAGRIPFPSKGHAQATLDALEAACSIGDVAAFIAEPLVLGAGGMLMYEVAALSEMALVCKEYGVLFIADEVMTGFGRTGTLFACEQAGVSPDILCLAKGLTGGTVPLAATLCRADIFEAHVSADRTKTFFHSSSYTANPICCAAANANLAIWRDEPVLDRIRALGEVQRERLARFENQDAFDSMRQLGIITALDLKGHGEGYAAAVALKLRAYFLSKGILLRPLGNTIYVMPPYCSNAADLDLVYEAIAAAPAEVMP
jgi:adenosylmethionine-8-amino-7-oxononanoate aminotransferase